MKNKACKAQMKVKQMAFLIIAVIVVLLLVGVFLINIRYENLKKTASQLEQQNAVLLASKIANSPEFSCGGAYGSKRSNCIDFDKVMMLKNNIWKYEDFWGVSNLEIRIIYDFKGKRATTPCTYYQENGEYVGNYPNCNYIKLIDEPSMGYDVSSFVTVCRKDNLGYSQSQEVCNLGKIFVRYENVN